MTDTDLESALRDVAFMAKNLRPRGRITLDYIADYANLRLRALGHLPSSTDAPVRLLRPAKDKAAGPVPKAPERAGPPTPRNPGRPVNNRRSF